MAKKQQPAWQFKFTLALSIMMLFLIFGYFSQSFLEIRKVKPVSVAIERISGLSAETDVNPENPQTTGTEEKVIVDH